MTRIEKINRAVYRLLCIQKTALNVSTEMSDTVNKLHYCQQHFLHVTYASSTHMSVRRSLAHLSIRVYALLFDDCMHMCTLAFSSK